MRFLLLCCAIILAFVATCVECNQRVKRQGVPIGFGLNPAQNHNLQGAVNGFIGGLFPNQNQNNHNPNHQNHNHQNPNQNHNNGRPFNPFNLFNQFVGGVFNQNQACSNNNGGCEQGCRMRRGRRQCFCNVGYVLNTDQVTCSDIDECGTGQNQCQGVCANTEGSFVCSCFDGAVLLDDGVSCGEASTSCAQNNGGCEQNCRDKPKGGVKCRCTKGYEINTDQRTCSDVDECASGTHSCQGTETCTNTIGSFECIPEGGQRSCEVDKGGCQQKCQQNKRGVLSCGCRKKFELQSDGVSCVASGGQVQSGCNVENGGCEHKCKTKRRGPKCGCRRNFNLQADGKSCLREGGFVLPTDPCQSNNGGCDQICVNNNGQVTCECESGFVFGNGFCQPQDPCLTNNGGCEHVCINNNGNSVCECNPGFILENGGCKILDLCQTNNGGCDQVCVNNNGNVICECNVGFVQANGFCQPEDPCKPSNGGCEQLCVNNNGNVVCECNLGFILSNGACLPLDPCQSNNGGCDQKCVNENGNVKCECNSGFVFANGFCQHQIQIPSLPIQNTPSPDIPKAKGCGVNTKKSLFRRIVGGKPADPKDWPWMAALLRSVGNQQFCGGALITDRHILTAAHCVISFTKNDIKVRLGEYNFDTPDENNPTDFRVEEIKSHTGYNQQTQENDIAVIKLGRASSFSEFIWPVCLPPPGNDFEDQLGYVTGWGTIHFGGPVSNVLQEVVIPVWKQADCVSAYKENSVTETMMCAGLKAGGKDSCQGDSGGPFLVQIFPETRWYLAGVVSWGIECASANRPGVYTRVNKYLDWIKENSVF